MKTQTPILIIAGPTAVGKTGLALELARQLNGEIISADSMQVYKHLSIGTAKPRSSELAGIPYHLIDHVEPDDQYNLGRFIQEAHDAITEIFSKGKVPIVCGGTGLYIKGLVYGIFQGGEANLKIRADLEHRAVVEGLEKLYQELIKVDPGAAHVLPNDKQRIIRYLEVYYNTDKPLTTFQTQNSGQRIINALIILLRRERSILYSHINMRVNNMVEEGLLEEVKNYLSAGYSISNPAIKALGYSEIISALKNEIPMSDALEKMKQISRNYAKRQETWFKKQDFDLMFDLGIINQEEIVRQIENMFSK